MGRLEALGRYRVPNDSVRQVVVAGKYALLHVGPSTLHIVDVGNPSEPKRVLDDSQLGLFYYNPIARGLLADRYACCHWHVTGLYWYDLSSEVPQASWHSEGSRIGSQNGVAFLGDRALVTSRGGYVLVSKGESRALDELEVNRIPDLALSGKPTISGDRLYVSDRYRGIVTALNITDPQQPQLIDQLELEEHPGVVAVHNGIPIIPGGYQGLLVWDKYGLK